jgi:proteasome accessory factor C
VAEPAEGRLGKRLRRILLMLPYAIQHPGVTVDELSRKFEVDRKDLVADLNLLFVCGLPGYGPGDLIDVVLDDDRVFVRMADYFAAPLKLTPAEAIVLYARGQALIELPEMGAADSLRRALTKLGRALRMAEGGQADKPDGIEMRLHRGRPDHLMTIRKALDEGKRVHLEYYSANRGEMTVRDVDPWLVTIARGNLYFVGWDHLSGDERIFRADRIKSVEVLAEPADVPGDLDPGRYATAFVEHSGERTISLEISPDAARWFEDYIPVKSSKSLPDEWRAVEIVADSDTWAATLIMRLAGDARNVKPESIMAEARRLAKLIEDRHLPSATR